jgi:hypothetical protein
LLMVAEDTLRDNFTKAQKALGMRHRSLYQAKHTYAVLALLDGESPAVVARSLGISLATLEKHYAAALQKGRTIAVETPRETPRRVAGGKNAREQKRPRRDLHLKTERHQAGIRRQDDGGLDVVAVRTRVRLRITGKASGFGVPRFFGCEQPPNCAGVPRGIEPAMPLVRNGLILQPIQNLPSFPKIPKRPEKARLVTENCCGWRWNRGRSSRVPRW